MFPGPHDWRFDKIEEQRAKELEQVMLPGELTPQLAMCIAAGIKDGARYGRDYKNGFPRVTVEISVPPKLYDQFFNGRRGYRAHYWARADVGNDFDSSLICLLRQAISDHMPTTVEGR